MQQSILALLLFLSAIIAGKAQGNQNQTNKKITVSVVAILKGNGQVHFALFNKENFRKEAIISKTATVVNGKSTVVFENIEPSEYAIICYQDENNNGQLDFDLYGRPLENYGTSNNIVMMGPPQFKDAKFLVENESLTLEIKF